MNNIYLFDVDGTLSKNGIIPSSAIDVLNKLKKNGNIVMLATGRCLGQLKKELRILNVDGAILNNGSYAIIDNKEVYKNPISKETIKQMLDDNLHLSFLSKDSFFKIENHKVFKDFCDYFTIDEPLTLNKEFVFLNDVYSMGLYGYDLDNLNISKYNLNFIRVAPLGYDIINKGITKASPINALRKSYPNHKIIAFGDNYNDIDMLKSADVSIVMNQAPKEVKDCASFVTKDPLDDGILYAYNNYLRGRYEN